MQSPITTVAVGALTKRVQRPTSSIYRSALSTSDEIIEMSVAHEVTNTGFVNSAMILDNTRVLTDSSNLGKPERIRLTLKIQYKDLSVRDDRDAEIASMIAGLVELLGDTTTLAAFLNQEA